MKGKLDCCIRDVTVNKHENIFTAHIICILVVPYSTKSAFCQVLVKLSNTK